MVSDGGKRIIFFILLIAVLAGSLYLFKRETVMLEQYQCYLINYGVINTSVPAGFTPAYDIKCFGPKEQPETLCYACAQMSKGLFAETQIQRYIQD